MTIVGSNIPGTVAMTAGKDFVPFIASNLNIKAQTGLQNGSLFPHVSVKNATTQNTSVSDGAGI